MTTSSGCGLIALFGEKANQLQVAKGDRVYVEGRLKLETWTSRDGQARSGLKVAAWKCERLGNIGNNKPAKTKRDDAARRDSSRDWQRPGAMDYEIPFTPATRG